MASTTESALWIALGTALGVDTETWLRTQREEGRSWRDIEATCAEAGVPVSHEWLRSQAKAHGLDRKVA